MSVSAKWESAKIKPASLSVRIMSGMSAFFFKRLVNALPIAESALPSWSCLVSSLLSLSLHASANMAPISGFRAGLLAKETFFGHGYFLRRSYFASFFNPSN